MPTDQLKNIGTSARYLNKSNSVRRPTAATEREARAHTRAQSVTNGPTLRKNKYH